MRDLLQKREVSLFYQTDFSWGLERDGQLILSPIAYSLVKAELLHLCYDLFFFKLNVEIEHGSMGHRKGEPWSFDHNFLFRLCEISFHCRVIVEKLSSQIRLGWNGQNGLF